MIFEYSVREGFFATRTVKEGQSQLDLSIFVSLIYCYYYYFFVFCKQRNLVSAISQYTDGPK